METKPYSVSVFDSRNTCRTIDIGYQTISDARECARATAISAEPDTLKYIVQTKEMGGWFEVYERRTLGLASPTFAVFSQWEKTEWSA